MRRPFMVRCYAKQVDGVWVAICIDLCLAVQGDSLEEVKGKLHEQMVDYVREALTVDYQHAHDLLNRRRAPFSQRLEYQVLAKLQMVIGVAKWLHRCAFETFLPPVRLAA